MFRESNCERTSYSILQSAPFKPCNWPGYEMKRHQVGKSFHSRIVNSTTYYCIK